MTGLARDDRDVSAAGYGRGAGTGSAAGFGGGAGEGSAAGFGKRAGERSAGFGRDRSARAAFAREYRDIFELGGVPAYRQFYDQGVFVWKALYRGSYAPWHMVPAPTVADPGAMRQMYRLNAAKAVSAELAGLVWGDACDIRVSRRDADGGPDALNGFVQYVLKRNALGEKMQQLVEQGLALGGAAIKVWYEDGETCGSAAEGGGGTADGIRLGYAMADQFVPLAWDNARVTEGVFISRRARGGHYYTRLEWHRWNPDRAGKPGCAPTYVIDNELYRSKMPKGDGAEDQDILGVRVPLADAFPRLDERTEIRVGDSLFTYWRTPIANNLDDNSPLGMSIYGNALETLHALDICYDSFVNEFRLGKKRIIVPARCVRTVVDPATGAPRRYFDPRDEVYEAFASDDHDELKVQDNSVELRVEEHVAALNAFLSVLCLQLGFSANTFSFDERGGIKTATEVVSENSKTYKTIKTVQNQLAPALEHLVRNIVDVACLYGVTWEGRPVGELARGGYEVKVTFDDGVTQDRQTSLKEGIQLVGAGLLSKFTFLTDRKYGQGLTESEALEELERIRREKE